MGLTLSAGMDAQHWMDGAPSVCFRTNRGQPSGGPWSQGSSKPPPWEKALLHLPSNSRRSLMLTSGCVLQVSPAAPRWGPL